MQKCLWNRILQTNYKGAYSAYLLCNQHFPIASHSQYSATCCLILLGLAVASCNSFGILSIAQHNITIFQDIIQLYDSGYLWNKDINTYVCSLYQEYAEKSTSQQFVLGLHLDDRLS